MKLSEEVRRYPHIVHQQKQHEWADKLEALEAGLAQSRAEIERLREELNEEAYASQMPRGGYSHTIDDQY